MIDWDDLLGTTEHKKALEELQTKFSSMEKAADYLGVSKIALRTKLITVGIPMKPRGGLNPQTRQRKSRLDAIPPRFFQEFPIHVIAQYFDVDPSVVYKYARRRGIQIGRKDNAVSTGQDTQDETVGLSSESPASPSDLDAEGGHSGIPAGGITRVDGKALRLIQDRNTKKSRAANE